MGALHSHKPAGKKIIYLYMHNNIDDVALTNISKETNYFHVFMHRQNQMFSPFLSLR